MSKGIKRFLYTNTILSMLLIGNIGVLASEVNTTQTSTGAVEETNTISDNATTTNTQPIDSTSATSSSSLETSSTEVEQSTESVQQSEALVDEASNSQDTPEKVYDLQIGLDPTDRNRSDLKEQVGSIKRNARSAGVAAITAGDSSTPSQDFIDVSSHNGMISVEQYKIIKSYGVTAVVVKLTEATSYRNPLAASQIANAQAAGLMVHAYHYSWYTNEAQAKAEADYFVKYAKELKLPTSALMVNDIEDGQIKGKANHTALSKVFVNRIKELGYNNTHHYIGVSWVNEKAIDPAALGYNNVWIANYPYVPASQKYTEYSAWQWTYNLSFPGISGTFDMSSDYKQYFTGQGQGSPIKDNRYATITKDNYTIWQNFLWKKKADSKAYLGQTFQIKCRYEHSNGSTYYSLYDNKGNWVGYLNATGTKTTNNAQGVWQSKDKYVKFKSVGNVYRDFTFKSTAPVTTAMLKNTYKVTGKYHHFNGKVYDSIKDMNGNWIGYIEENKLTNQEDQGPAIADNRYATIVGANHSVWQNFSWKFRSNTEALLGRTFKVKCHYKHLNGSVYLSLYDNKDNWIGYINANGTKLSNSISGTSVASNKYVTVNTRNYSIWQNFSGKEKMKSSKIYGKTYQVRCYYKHFNGSTYYSLYDNKGNWQGYINSTGVKEGTSAAGMPISSNKYVTVNTKSYSVWQNFSGKEKMKSSKIYGKTYQVRSYYNHFNGSTYYSLYDNKGNWQGYINSTGVKEGASVAGMPFSSNIKVEVTRKDYSIWQNFLGKEKSKSSNLYGKTYQVKCYYNHFNGSTYYSLYDNKGTWQGYINKTGTRQVN